MTGKMTDYPRCKTCKWWKTHHFESGEDYECVNFGINDHKRKDGFDLITMFCTGPDFGCIHHESKESE